MSVRGMVGAVLDGEEAARLRLGPGRHRGRAVIGVDGVEPTQADALLLRLPGIDDPLRAAPDPLARAPGAEHELRDPLHQGAQPRLAVAQPVLGRLPVGDVQHELDRGAVVQHACPANSPHQRDPSLRMYSFSKGLPWPVAFSSSRALRVAASTPAASVRPSAAGPPPASSRVKPDMRRKAALASVIRPSMSKKITPTVSISATRRNRSSLLRSRASRSRRSVVMRRRFTAAARRLA